MIPLPLTRATCRLAVATSFLLLSSVLTAATSITQYGITWTLAHDYPSGQFANGDYWVVGPVTVTDITPRPTAMDGIAMHGSMINPKPNTAQAFDSRISHNTFKSSLNVAAAFPFTVPAGSSLLSSESFVAKSTGNDPQLKTIAILTVLDQPPPAGSFRPPYAGTDKRLRWTVADLDWSRLRSLPRVPHAPSLSSLEELMRRPFIDIRSSWSGTYLQPKTNHPAYGREISHQVGAALLSLQLDYPVAEKQALLVHVVQRGIDLYGLARNGAHWSNDGGHRHGRKPVLIAAGAVLNSPEILAFADAQRAFIFQEDQQTFYVSAEDVSRPRKTSDGRRRDAYTEGMIGTPEWGGKHVGEPEGDAAQWDAHYRNVCGASTVGTVLAARLMGLESTWNWPVLFEYMDRYVAMEESKSTKDTNSIQPFVKAMWRAYRQAPAVEYVTGPSPVEAPIRLPKSRLSNLSTRGRAASGESAMIAGFVIGGAEPRPILLRGIGPSLTGLGVPQALRDAELVLYRGSTRLAASSHWGRQSDAGDIAATTQRVGAFALSAESADAALTLTLEPGAYTAQLTNRSSAGGVGLIEVYDAGAPPADGTTAPFVNLSTRGWVGRGDDILIAGIVVADGASKRLLVRAVGPGLLPLGVSTALTDPVLRVLRGNDVIASNDNWQGDPDIAAAATAAGAFALAPQSRDGCLLVTLPPGNYTAQVSGRDGATGVALVEVYEAP